MDDHCQERGLNTLKTEHPLLPELQDTSYRHTAEYGYGTALEVGVGEGTNTSTIDEWEVALSFSKHRGSGETRLQVSPRHMRSSGSSSTIRVSGLGAHRHM